ncbi:MAG: nucleotidyltransferase family protein [Pseudomonadota bacterium]
MGLLEHLRQRRQEILEIAARHGACNVRVFGSTARGSEGTSSDIDLLVDMEEGRTLYDLVALQQDLERLLRRRTDVLTPNALSPYLKDRILTEAQPL